MRVDLVVFFYLLLRTRIVKSIQDIYCETEAGMEGIKQDWKNFQRWYGMKLLSVYLRISTIIIVRFCKSH